MRTVMKRKQSAVRAANEARAEFLRNTPLCMDCGLCPPEHCHEIASGPARSKAIHEPVCWLSLCGPCHTRAHEKRDLARELALKAIVDFGAHYDRQRVNELRGRSPDAISEVEVIQAAYRLGAKQ
jgi:hypothetical protein